MMGIVSAIKRYLDIGRCDICLSLKGGCDDLAVETCQS